MSARVAHTTATLVENLIGGVKTSRGEVLPVTRDVISIMDGRVVHIEMRALGVLISANASGVEVNHYSSNAGRVCYLRGSQIGVREIERLREFFGLEVSTT